MYINGTLQYSLTGYPLRKYEFSSEAVTNSTTSKILYLLASADGIYSTYQVLNYANQNAIEGASLVVERTIDSVSTILGSGLTDSAGSITFWLNPNYAHTITTSKTGYTTTSVSVSPSQSTYTIYLGGAGNVTINDYRYKNIVYYTYPASGRLEPNTNYTFGIVLNATDANLVNCKIEVKDENFTVVNSSTGCSASYGNISTIVDVTNYDKLFGYYYVDIGSGYELLKANDAWFMEFNNASSGLGLINFFSELRGMDEFGSTHNRQEFSAIIFFFFIMIILIGIFTYTTGYEMGSPGAGMILVWGFITIGAVAGFFALEGITPSAWLNKYVIWWTYTAVYFGYILNYIRRETQ